MDEGVYNEYLKFIDNCFSFHIFFFSFDTPSGSIAVLVVLSLGSENNNGVSPSGKAQDFDSCIHVFKSHHPSLADVVERQTRQI